MTPYEAIQIIEQFGTVWEDACESGRANEVSVEAWQHLHDTGVAYQLQGWYGRTAQHFIAEGIINP